MSASPRAALERTTQPPALPYVGETAPGLPTAASNHTHLRRYLCASAFPTLNDCWRTPFSEEIKAGSRQFLSFGGPAPPCRTSGASCEDLWVRVRLARTNLSNYNSQGSPFHVVEWTLFRICHSCFFFLKKKGSSVLCLSPLPRFMISAEPQEGGSRTEHRISSSPGFMDWRYQSSSYTYGWCILMISKMTQSNSGNSKSLLVSLKP